MSKVLEKGAMIPKSQCSQAKSLFLSIVDPLQEGSLEAKRVMEKRDIVNQTSLHWTTGSPSAG